MYFVLAGFLLFYCLWKVVNVLYFLNNKYVTLLAGFIFNRCFSFIVSILTYCLPILITSIYSRVMKTLRKGDRLGLDIGDLDSVMSKRTKNLALQIIHEDEHFLNSFLEKLPSGRYRSLKYRTARTQTSDFNITRYFLIH